MRGWWAPFAIDKGWGKCRTGGLLVADLAEAQDLRGVEFSGFDGKGEGRMRATIAANTPTTR